MPCGSKGGAMGDVLNAILGFLTGVFGIVLGVAYFLPIVLLILAIGIFFYLRQRRGRPSVFSAEEPGRRRRR